MHASIAKKLAKKMKRQAGFTLLEILVVLTIMGFLIAMVAPRLAGISGDAVDTVCDSNQNRMISMMSGYFEKTNRYPNKLTNLVDQVDAVTYQMPAISDNDPDNGAETIATEFNDRNHFRIHYLSTDEAKELKNLGIVRVFNLNAYDAYNEEGTAIKNNYSNVAGVNNDVALATAVTKNATMAPVTPAAGVGVMMIGAGIDNTGAWNLHTEERGWGEGDFLARIVFGFGPENGLVTSGIVSNAAHCPGGIQNADNVTYNDYNIVLPRLDSTVKRFDGTTMEDIDNDDEIDGVQLLAVAYNDDPAEGSAYDITGNDENLKVRTFTLEAMESYQYATMCPEGHKFPADDEEFWGLSLDGDTSLDAMP